MQRVRLVTCHRAATKIQASFRGHRAHSAFLQMRTAATLLQVMLVQTSAVMQRHLSLLSMTGAFDEWAQCLTTV